MKIGVDIRPLQEPYPTGVSEYARELLGAIFLIDRENEYHLFTNAAKNFPIPQFPNSPNIVLHRFHYPNKFLNASMRFARFPKLDQLMANLDLFFMTDFDFVATSPRTPLVVTAHDLSFEHYPSFFTAKQRVRSRLIRPRELLARAAHILAVSEHTKRDLVAHYRVAPHAVTVTPLGVAERFFTEPNPGALETVRTRYELPGNFILFLGTVGARKNVAGIIESFELLKRDPQFTDLHLVIAGHGGLTPSPSRLKPYIHFLGYVPFEDRPALYRLARAFIYPSYYEGFGLPPLEAMAAGTPVVASFTSSLGEVIGKAGILTDPYNLEDLSRALMHVLTDQTLANRLQELGRERARQFSWEQTARTTLDVFHSIAKPIPIA